MSQDEADSMNNAAAIIERFGGIRPTAAKVGAPVTTVQGWKKRDVIPASRRGDVVRAARENGIDLSDLAGAAGSSAASAPSAGATDRTRKTVPAEKSVFIGGAAGVVENAAPKEAGPKEADKKDIKEEQAETAKITVEPLVRPQAKKPLPPGYTGIDTTHEELMDAIARGQKKAVSASVWTAVCIAAVLAGAGVLAFLPSAKKIERHEEKIASIEGQMGEVNETARSFKDLLPEDMRQKMAALKEEAAAIRSDVQRVAKDAQDISRTVLAADAGSLSDRLSVLEAKFGDMEGGQALKDLTARIRNLEVTIAGQEQIQASVAELTQIVDSIDGQVNALGDKMAEAKQIPGSALGETLEGVSGNDMKAAALLIAFSQLRDSLNRNEPFENDLALLQKLVGNDDPELQMALARLAPQAEKGGVLTAQGLSGELKSMTGDIVFASLQGEEVSVSDKAKARLTQILNVKKDGELVGGTDTQKTVARAQEQLDNNDIQGAIATLQALDGAAKEKAQPLIEQAQATVLAEQIQNMLRQMIVASVGTDIGTAAGQGLNGAGNALSEALGDSGGTIQNMIPGQQGVVRDEESGFSILPPQRGFKGFSPGSAE